MRAEYLEAGRICTAHGVRGALKVEHFCDSAAVLAKQKKIYFAESAPVARGAMGIKALAAINGVGGGCGGGEVIYTEHKVVSASASGQFVIMTVEGIDSREAAIAQRGRIIYLSREDIPVAKGAMLIADMIGLPVYHAESGERLGEISDVSDVAGRRIYTVRCESGEVMLPDVPEFIKEISEDRGMRVLPIPGFFDAADEV